MEVAQWSSLRKLFPIFSLNMHDEIISRLLYMESMRAGWEKLDAATKSQSRHMRVAFGFLHTSLDAYMGYAASKVRPIAEHRDHYHGIAKRIRDLIQEVGHDPEFGLSRYGNALHHRSEQGKQMTNELADFARRQGVLEETAVEIAEAGRVFAMQYGESLGKMLENLATEAENIAKAGPLSLHPNRKDAHEHYFVRRTTKWMLDELKRPLYAVSACAANALFASDMDPNHVQKLVRRNWK